jgi:hypothetical protein
MSLPHHTHTWSLERTAKQLALFRGVLAGAQQLGLQVTMPIQAANNFASRAHIANWQSLKDAINADIHWDLPGDVRFTARRKISLPCETITLPDNR